VRALRSDVLATVARLALPGVCVSKEMVLDELALNGMTLGISSVYTHLKELCLSGKLEKYPVRTGEPGRPPNAYRVVPRDEGTGQGLLGFPGLV
jgi:predicted ArsR family transcriptional regulator